MTRAGKRMADEKKPDAGVDIRAKKDVTLTGVLVVLVVAHGFFDWLGIRIRNYL